jgi:hypothetical protein
MATGGIALNGSSQYLRLNSRVVSAFPFTLVCWVAAGTGASSQMVFLQQQSNADRYSAAFLNTIGSQRNPGNSDSAGKGTAPDPATGTLKLMVAVFASTTSRTIYFGDNTGVTSTTTMTDDISNHDRVTIGAWEYNSGGPGLYLNGTVAEAHIFNTALSSSDVTTLLTTTPESVSGWVDGWVLSGATDLTSIGGTRTLTAIGSPTTASLTLPYTRGPAGFTLTADQGSYSYTGQAAGTLATRIIAADQGSYLLAGQAANLVKATPGAFVLSADSGTYQIDGQPSYSDYVMVADYGVYALAGQDAALNRTFPQAYSLTADRGLYAVTGRAAALRWSNAPIVPGKQAGIYIGMRIGL